MKRRSPSLYSIADVRPAAVAFTLFDAASSAGVIAMNWAPHVYYDPLTVFSHNVEGRVIERLRGNKKSAALFANPP